MAKESIRSEGDRYLIDAIRTGDAEAYRQLVQRFSGRLTACAARRLRGTGVDAEDAVQETFVGLLQSIHRLDNVRSLEAYLFRILRNKIADLTGKRPEAHGMHRVPLYSADESNEVARGYDPIAKGHSPSTYARQDEAREVRNEVLADILGEAINDLKEARNFRDLKSLELLFYGSWRNCDIAVAVGTSEPTVTRIKAAALEKLSRLAGRHPRMDRSLNLFASEEDLTHLIRDTWQEGLLSCLKRSTLGAYSLNTLDEDWSDYIRSHLETVGCEICQANLEDLQSETSKSTALEERLFASSIGFLRRKS